MQSDVILLSVAAMYAADRATIAGGVPGKVLMENAGGAVAAAIRERYERGRVLVLCGPGNNGGDGFVVARLLAEQGWPVQLVLLGDRGELKGDAAAAAASWAGPVDPPERAEVEAASLVVDALFGAGLDRPLEGAARTLVERVAASGRPVVAVDVPSGVQGDTGLVLGCAAQAALTVTFCRRKPGHLLLPGRLLVGEVVVADIGIPDEVVHGTGSRLRANEPPLWLDCLPRRTPLDHKYTFGHAVVAGGDLPMTGAARLAARAALRVGAGLVTIACPTGALGVYAATNTAVMVRPYDDEAGFRAILEDPRRNAVLLGPGAGVGEALRRQVLLTLGLDRRVVLDADALTSFQGEPEVLFGAVRGTCVLTPHDGELARLLDLEGDRLARALAAAERSGCVVLLKGGDTVVAAPDGRAAIHGAAPPELATAGTGDVLAGLVLGLLAQGMPGFEAAAAAVWLHGASAARFGPGLIAEDLGESLPAVLRELRR
jgi:ADP-dependent NAD(P)H-hydrate dehydratase / NAD(P)H-hydrate epimerase